MSWLKAMNPSAPINGEGEARKAARSSAVSIFIGVIAGIVGSVYSFMNADAITAAAAAGAEMDAATAAAMQASVQMGLWLGVGLTVVQLVFGLIQWRDPKKFIAILFLVLIALGLVMLLATPMLASMAPAGTPETPMWQTALGAAVMVVQAVLHIAGLRGINKLDDIQMAAAR